MFDELRLKYVYLKKLLMDNERGIQVSDSSISDDGLLNYEKLEDYLKVTTFEFQPNQYNISFPIIERICKRLIAGQTFSPIQISNGVIIDGHHRYISLLLLNKNLKHVLLSENISCKYEIRWADVILSKVDHDTLEQKQHYDNRYGIV